MKKRLVANVYCGLIFPNSWPKLRLFQTHFPYIYPKKR